MRKIAFFQILVKFFLAQNLFAQAYTYYSIGDTSDVTIPVEAGLVLAGGGGDNDHAMRAMLQKATGGDIVVIRASGAGGYNPYFYDELGVQMHSVETIRFNNATAAQDPWVIRKIRNAEVLFIAGGDQYVYHQYWKDTPVEDALHYLILEKKAIVGGTSAGMAILGDAYYAPSGGSLTSEQALGNPFHPNTDVLGKGDFIQHPLLKNLITDTHYDQRNRSGRHLVFLARLVSEHQTQMFGIACNEYVAIVFNEDGSGKVYGDFPTNQDYAYFLKSNCQDDPTPEILQPAVPLTWNRFQSAVKVKKVVATPQGTPVHLPNLWDIPDDWENWYAEAGNFQKITGSEGDCKSILTHTSDASFHQNNLLFPNPAGSEVFLYLPCAGIVRLFSTTGRQLAEENFGEGHQTLSLRHLPEGFYLLQIQTQNATETWKIRKM